MVGECLCILQNEEMLLKLNKAHIVLIPKKDSLKTRVIYALYIVLYKIIVKTQANRLKRVLLLVVLDAYSAFILGRLIIDNILIVSEVLHYVKQKR